ncbi:MAG: GIY-YIG nuclease family protein [Saprospiraceae bacterium]|nr:GIY-YIG nuclease family protein [Saprospiraceae bacterium]
MKKKKYAIIDVETTGGMSRRDRITEIGILIHDGEREIERFETLINPERDIPWNITQITGITNEMVVDAPKFFEIAKRVVQMTEGAVFVAHNARFDYGFIKYEFERLGYTYTRRQLCTIRLCRKVFPQIRSYSLGNLIKHFNIHVDQRHRAMADVLATTEIFEKALRHPENQETIHHIVNSGIKESKLPPNITLDILHALPEKTGVYYFHDSLGQVVYVGKSLNIKKRVLSHFSKTTRKAEKLVQYVHDISFEITGSELVALLLESFEIKHRHPHINRAQRARNFPWILFKFTDSNGYVNLDFRKVNKKEQKNFDVIKAYPNQHAAKGALNRLLEELELCQNLCNIEPLSSPCFNYQLGKCLGACAEKEPQEDYNKRLMEGLQFLDQDFPDDFIVLDAGRHSNEWSVILVEEGYYQGFGYIEKDSTSGDIEELKDAIVTKPNNPEVQNIIRHFVLRGSVEKVILLSSPEPLTQNP